MLKGPIRIVNPAHSFRVRRFWILWRYEYDVIKSRGVIDNVTKSLSIRHILHQRCGQTDTQINRYLICLARCDALSDPIKLRHGQYSLGVMVTPNALSLRILNRISWFLAQCSTIGFASQRVHTIDDRGFSFRTVSFRNEKEPNFGRSAIARHVFSQAVVIMYRSCHRQFVPVTIEISMTQCSKSPPVFSSFNVYGYDRVLISECDGLEYCDATSMTS